MAYNFKEGDMTHFNRKGAEAITDLVIQELKEEVPSIAVYIEEGAVWKSEVCWIFGV